MRQRFSSTSFKRQALTTALLTSSALAAKRSSTIARNVLPIPQGLYFQQLTAGKEFALSNSQVHQFARQMNNFVYIIGDKEEGVAAVIDGAWDPVGIQELTIQHNLTLTVELF
jgi:hypothetical protein